MFLRFRLDKGSPSSLSTSGIIVDGSAFKLRSKGRRTKAVNTFTIIQILSIFHRNSLQIPFKYSTNEITQKQTLIQFTRLEDGEWCLWARKLHNLSNEFLLNAIEIILTKGNSPFPPFSLSNSSSRNLNRKSFAVPKTPKGFCKASFHTCLPIYRVTM